MIDFPDFLVSDLIFNPLFAVYVFWTRDQKFSQKFDILCLGIFSTGIHGNIKRHIFWENPKNWAAQIEPPKK